MAEILGLDAPVRNGPFVAVQLANGVALDFMDSIEHITPQHYAFAITDPEFDEIFGRVQEQALSYWADPHRTRRGEIRQHHGSRGVYFRGVYFEDPSGHLLEILTRPDG